MSSDAETRAEARDYVLYNPGVVGFKHFLEPRGGSRSYRWNIITCATLLLVATLCACSTRRHEASVTRTIFGKMPDGSVVDVFTLTNAQGMEVRAITYGGIITSLRVPDRTGRFDDVVLGHDNLDGYLNKSRYFGAIIGRYGNRIAKGSFTLDGIRYTLATNNGPNHLHGGVKGFDKVVWQANEFRNTEAVGVVFQYTSRDGEEGYPGTLNARVTYTREFLKSEISDWTGARLRGWLPVQLEISDL